LVRKTGLGKGVVRLSLVVTEVSRAGGKMVKTRVWFANAHERTILKCYYIRVVEHATGNFKKIMWIDTDIRRLNVGM